MSALHIGDKVEHLDSKRDYIVQAIYQGHAVADGITNPNDQISIPIDNGTYEITDTRGFKMVSCIHPTVVMRVPPDLERRIANTSFNVGAMDSSLRELSWIFRDLSINAGAVSPERITAVCDEAVAKIHRTYSILRSMGQGPVSRGILSKSKLPPVN